MNLCGYKFDRVLTCSRRFGRQIPVVCSFSGQPSDSCRPALLLELKLLFLVFLVLVASNKFGHSYEPRQGLGESDSAHQCSPWPPKFRALTHHVPMMWKVWLQSPVWKRERERWQSSEVRPCSGLWLRMVTAGGQENKTIDFSPRERESENVISPKENRENQLLVEGELENQFHSVGELAANIGLWPAENVELFFKCCWK